MNSRKIDLRRHKARPSVAILLPAQTWMGAVFLARDLLQVTGTLAARSTDVVKSAIFETQLIGRASTPVSTFGGGRVRPETTIANRRRYDIVLIPPQFGLSAERSSEDLALGSWLRRQHRDGAFVLAMGGTLLLAKAELLDGLRATGFVSERALFARSFPKVRYMPSRRLVAEERIVTICGIGPIVDGCAHLIEHFHGGQLARRFLRHTSTDVLPAEEHLALWASHLKRHGDRQVIAAQELIERELQHLPTMLQIADHAATSERTLSRRFTAATGVSLRSYVASLRLELADFLLRSSQLSLSRIADECGYGSVSALSRAFSARHSIGPARHRARERASRG